MRTTDCEVRRSAVGRALRLCGLTALAGACMASAGRTADLSRLVIPLDATGGIVQVEGDGRIVAEGPNAAKALRTDGKVEVRIDLKALGVEAKAYDLIKIDAKADPRAWLVVSLENYPRPGWISNWYALDSVRGGFDWRTIWVDLKRPEEMYQSGKVGGMAGNDTEARGLRVGAYVQPAKRMIQDPGRSVLIRNVRLVKKAVHLDWDQTQAPYTWDKGKDLVFSYPLTVSNRLEKPVKAKVVLLPFKARDAKAVVSPDAVEIAPGKTATVTATVSLPAAVAAKERPLYSELFEARASVEGLEDSDVTILRSSDPIHLSVTVPVPEPKLAFPLLPRRKGLPASVLAFEENVRKTAAKAAEAASPDHLDAWLGQLAPDRFQQPWRRGKLDDEAGNLGKFVHGVSACAFLYDFTGERKYLDKGTAMLLRAAERFPALWKRWSEEEIALVGDGIIRTNTLGLGWMTGGDWPPYEFPRRGGQMFNDFDLLAAHMEPAARERIVRDFIVPAAIQMRNHYFGLTNQQDVVNYPVLYAGLAARNWPLAAFAYAAEHGVLGQIQWGFDEDGLCNEGHYQTAVINPMLWTTELLHHVAGIDLYDQRLWTILHSKSAEAIGKAYHGKNIVAYLDEHRFAGKPFLKELQAQPKTDGVHLSGGATQLKWQGLSLSMNWGTHIFRNAHDRCALRFEAAREHPLRALNAAQGGSYSHSCIDQSIVVVNEGIQNSVPARVTGVDVSGPVQFVQATSDEHFPGVAITRTFALIDRHALVVDRVSGDPDQPFMVDWVFKMSDFKLSVPLAERQGSWTTKPDVPHTGATFGVKYTSHRYARTNAAFTDSVSRMTMLGEPDTELVVYPVWHQMKALMVRRRDVTQTDYVAFFSAQTKSVERLPVKKTGGKEAQAMGLKITLEDGKLIHVIVSYEPEAVEVVLGALKTKQRFATDYKE